MTNLTIRRASRTVRSIIRHKIKGRASGHTGIVEPCVAEGYIALVTVAGVEGAGQAGWVAEVADVVGCVRVGAVGAG